MFFINLNLTSDYSCGSRCANGSLLCTAHTDPYFDISTHYQDTWFSEDPVKNPAFHDFSKGIYGDCRKSS